MRSRLKEPVRSWYARVAPLFILLPLISLDEMATNSIIAFSGESRIYKLVVSFALLGTQLIIAPIQAGFSDHYCRRKNLLFALTVVALSLVVMLLFGKWGLALFVPVAFLKGAAGNVTPIARAGLADTFLKDDFRFSIGLSTVAIGVGYFLLAILDDFVSPWGVLGITCVPVLIGLYFTKTNFKDPRDQGHKPEPLSITKEIQSLYRYFLHNKNFSLSLLIYLLWEIAFYQLFIRDADLKYLSYHYVALTMCIGYFIGVSLLKITFKADRSNIIFGCLLALSVVIVDIAVRPYVTYVWELIFLGWLGLAYGLFTPSLFSQISSHKPVHHQGKIYGLIDSTDTLAFSLAVFMALNTKGLPHSFTLSLSLGLILLGFVIYLIVHKPNRTSQTYESK